MKYTETIMIVAAACVAMAGCAGVAGDSKAEAYKRWHATRADMLITKGEQQFASGDLDGAGGSAKEALSLSPGRPAALMLLGRVLIEQGDYVRSLKVLDKAAEITPDSAQIPYLKAVVYERRGQYGRALRLYEKARALDGDNPAYVLASAEAMVALGQAEAALGLLDSKLISMTESAGAYAMAGDIAMAIDRPRAAAGYYRQAGLIRPESMEFQERLAKAWFFAGEYKQARAVLESLSRTEPYDSKTWVFVMLGDCALTAHQPRAAKAAYVRATQLEPKQASHWSKLATASLACKDLPRTVLSARRALGLDPEALDASIALGYALLAQHKVGEAQAVLDKAERNCPGDAMVKFLLGRCHDEAGRADRAQAYYRAALQLDPAHAAARAVVAQAD